MNLHDDAHPHGHHVGATPAVGGAKDPDCGMMGDPQQTQYRAIHSRIDHFYCSSGSRTRFLADPARYLAAEERSPKPSIPECIARYCVFCGSTIMPQTGSL